MSIAMTRRVGGIALAAAFLASACSGGASSPSSAASPPAASTGDGSAAAIPAPPSSDVTLQGAGATFPAPLYQTWFETYGGVHPNVKVDYQAVGSGAGIKAITQQTVDFGASDAPMKDEELKALPAGTSVLHVPTALGAVVVIFNVPGVAAINLDGQNVADIFLGTITKWNDPKIAANNAGVSLPDKPILVVHRSDGSGTTNAFTSYLAAVSPDWNTKVGKGKEVNWPIGIGAKGNDGVAGGVQQNEGAVGYVELTYATGAKLPMASLKNADGAFIAPSTAGVTAAAEATASTFPADFRQAPIINAPGAQTYPIASYTYLLVYADQKDATKGQALVALMAWALTDGQAAEASLGYAPLPAAIQQKALAEVHLVTTGGAPIWP